MEDLVKDFCNGDPHAFKRIFLKYYRPIVFFALKFIPHEDVARDVASDSFEKLWSAHRDFTTEGEIRGFLYTCTKNACINHHKHSLVVCKHQLEAGRKMDKEVLDDLVLKAITQAELVRKLYAAIDHLPAEQRGIVVNMLEGATVVDIAKKMGLTPKVVRGRRAKALEILKMSFSSGMLISFLVHLSYYKRTG